MLNHKDQTWVKLLTLHWSHCEWIFKDESDKWKKNIVTYSLCIYLLISLNPTKVEGLSKTVGCSMLDPHYKVEINILSVCFPTEKPSDWLPAAKITNHTVRCSVNSAHTHHNQGRTRTHTHTYSKCQEGTAWVTWLPVDDSVPVQEHQGRCDLGGVKSGSRLIELPRSLDLEHQVSSVNVLHHEEQTVLEGQRRW